MTGPVVVDVGNTRMKWGRSAAGRIVDVAAVPPDAPDRWQHQLDRWPGAADRTWVIGGVQPQRRDALAAWLRSKGIAVHIVQSFRELPLAVGVDHPERVGIDRLFNAVAANRRRPGRHPAAVIDAGSAVTVDLLDCDGVFRGGAIFPGLRLMAQALHDHTALLPIVTVDRAEPLPATSTEPAIRAGVLQAVLGGAERIVAAYRGRFSEPLTVYLTGGDGPLLSAVLPGVAQLWPEMTLEGILHAVGGQAADA